MAQTFFTNRLKLVSYLDEKKDYIDVYLLQINRRIGQIFYSNDKEISLFIAPAYQKNGYAPEALEFLLKNQIISADSYARININGYENSQKLFKKLGFEVVKPDGNYEIYQPSEQLPNEIKNTNKESKKDIER